MKPDKEPDMREANAVKSEPMTELPLKGYYGGNPIRISIDYDDHSSTNIGNADGSVDRIVTNLQSRSLPATIQGDIKLLRDALKPFAEEHFMGDSYVRFAPRLLVTAREIYKITAKYEES